MLTLLDEIFIVVIGVGTLIGKKISYCEYSVFLSNEGQKQQEHYDKRASKTEDKYTVSVQRRRRK